MGGKGTRRPTAPRWNIHRATVCRGTAACGKGVSKSLPFSSASSKRAERGGSGKAGSGKLGRTPQFHPQVLSRDESARRSSFSTLLTRLLRFLLFYQDVIHPPPTHVGHARLACHIRGFASCRPSARRCSVTSADRIGRKTTLSRVLTWEYPPSRWLLTTYATIGVAGRCDGACPDSGKGWVLEVNGAAPCYREANAPQGKRGVVRHVSLSSARRSVLVPAAFNALYRGLSEGGSSA